MDALLSTANLVILGAVSALFVAFRRAAPALAQRSWVARIEPVASFPLCVGGVFLSSSAPVLIGDKVLLGCALAGLLAAGYGVVKQTVLGRDARIEREVVG